MILSNIPCVLNPFRILYIRNLNSQKLNLFKFLNVLKFNNLLFRVLNTVIVFENIVNLKCQKIGFCVHI